MKNQVYATNWNWPEFKDDDTTGSYSFSDVTKVTEDDDQAVNVIDSMPRSEDRIAARLDRLAEIVADAVNSGELDNPRIRMFDTLPSTSANNVLWGVLAGLSTLVTLGLYTGIIVIG